MILAFYESKENYFLLKETVRQSLHCHLDIIQHVGQLESYRSICIRNLKNGNC